MPSARACGGGSAQAAFLSEGEKREALGYAREKPAV
jgi:hypothetical protein